MERGGGALLYYNVVVEEEKATRSLWSLKSLPKCQLALRYLWDVWCFFSPHSLPFIFNCVIMAAPPFATEGLFKRTTKGGWRVRAFILITSVKQISGALCERCILQPSESSSPAAWWACYCISHMDTSTAWPRHEPQSYLCPVYFRIESESIFILQIMGEIFAEHLLPPSGRRLF